MKKILNLTNIKIFPPNSGGAGLIYHFLDKLSHNYEVVLVLPKSIENNSAKRLDNVKVYDLLSSNSFWKFFGPQTVVHLIMLVIKERPDYLIIDFPWFGIYGILARSLFGVPFIIHEHNIEFLRFKRLGKDWWPYLRLYERFVYRQADQILCISDVDKQVLINRFGVRAEKIIDCPYGIDSKVFRPNLRERKKVRKQLEVTGQKMVLFFGPLDYQPNREAVEVLSREIAPRVLKIFPKSIFVVVGRNPPPSSSHPLLKFTGNVDQIASYINASDLVVVPIRTGGGVRTKIIESLACGKVVVSTTLGAEGISPEDSEGKLLIADSWDKFSEQVVTSLNIKNTYEAPMKFVHRYEWTNIINNLKGSI